MADFLKSTNNNTYLIATHIILKKTLKHTLQMPLKIITKIIRPHYSQVLVIIINANLIYKITSRRDIHFILNNANK